MILFTFFCHANIHALPRQREDEKKVRQKKLIRERRKREKSWNEKALYSHHMCGVTLLSGVENPLNLIAKKIAKILQFVA